MEEFGHGGGFVGVGFRLVIGKVEGGTGIDPAMSGMIRVV
jgi:hypothetical protein